MIVALCDYCEKRIPDNVVRYKLLVDHVPSDGLHPNHPYKVAVYPPFGGEKHFCSMRCVSDFCIRTANETGKK